MAASARTARGVLNGAGAPALSTGRKGDFYIDTVAHAIYGPKGTGGWGAPTPLIGPMGPPGLDLEFDQAAPADTWVIAHGLGYRPNVSIQDSAGTVVLGDVFHDSDDQVTVRFSAPFSGRATLS